jgi:hypothetical protein
VTRAFALLMLLATAPLFGGCCESGTHSFVVDAPDPDLAALLQACLDACAPGSYSCYEPACVPVCRRVAELAGDTRTASAMDGCVVRSPVDGGTGAEIWIGYNTCH